MQKTSQLKAPAKKPATTAKKSASPAKKAQTKKAAPAKVVEETKVEEPVVPKVDPCDTSLWDHINLKGLMSKVETNFDNKKYTFIQDLQGNAPRFFEYSANLCDIEGDLKKEKLKMMPQSEILEKMRGVMVHSMRSGKKLCYNLGAEELDFSQISDEKELNTAVMFDYEQSRLHDNYVKHVHEDEMFDHISGKVDGTFFMQDKFGLVVITQTEDSEVLKRILMSLPHDKMAKLVIDP